VAGLIEQIGFTPIDTGSLATSRRQETDSPIYNRPMKAPDARAQLASIADS
jgi:predicted dinucleotide-binding enzyme